MNTRLPAWLKKDIRIKGLARNRVAPSPTAKMIGKIIQTLVLVGLCLAAIWRVSLHFEVKAKFARIRQAGLPASGAELNAWRAKVPDAENGALVLKQAFAELYTNSHAELIIVTDPRLLFRTNVWGESTRAAIAAYLSSNQVALGKARQAMPFTKFQYPIDFSFGPDTELPHLSHVKALARLAGLESAIQAESGLTNDWPLNTLLQLKLACSLDNEPIMISFFVRDGMTYQAAKATERNLRIGAPDINLCKVLQQGLANVAGTNLLPRALIGERAMMAPVFRMSWKELQNLGKENREPQRFQGRPWLLLSLTGFFERDLNFFLETMDEAVRITSADAPRSLALTNYFKTAMIRAEKKKYLFSSMLLPSLARAVVRDASRRMTAELASTALAVERFRLDNGRLPSALQELIPNYVERLPMDAFDGKPLRYRLLDPGYILYSVDSDGQDNGGREPPDRKKTSDASAYDITFVVPR